MRFWKETIIRIRSMFLSLFSRRMTRCFGKWVRLKQTSNRFWVVSWTTPSFQRHSDPNVCDSVPISSCSSSTRPITKNTSNGLKIDSYLLKRRLDRKMSIRLLYSQPHPDWLLGMSLVSKNQSWIRSCKQVSNTCDSRSESTIYLSVMMIFYWRFKLRTRFWRWNPLMNGSWLGLKSLSRISRILRDRAWRSYWRIVCIRASWSGQDLLRICARQRRKKYSSLPQLNARETI